MLPGGDPEERLLPGHAARQLKPRHTVDLEDQAAAARGRGRSCARRRVPRPATVSVRLKVLLLAGPIAPDCAAYLPLCTLLFSTDQLAAVPTCDNCQGEALKSPLSKPSETVPCVAVPCVTVIGWPSTVRWAVRAAPSSR